ncbi:MAG: aldo/keto reductase, partial [Chloroflexota bacterium]|nr:aldo/keto reductase [Chloroflexota bacterium]
MVVVKRKLLGNTDLEIPEIGLGTWRYSGGIEPLRAGVRLGASLIDTAEMYRTESNVGEAINEIQDQVFVATKVWGSNLKYDEVLRAAEQSIRRLGVNIIDLYQIHWPNSRVPIKETMTAMEQLVDRGLVRYIGVSNFSVGELDEAMSVME